MTHTLITRKELADAFLCSIATIRRWERAGKLKPIRLGACTVRFNRADVEQFLTAAAEVRDPQKEQNGNQP